MPSSERRAILGIAFALSIVAFLPSEKCVAAEVVRFTSDQVLLEPESEFLVIRCSGGMTTEIRTYSLRGDGRISIFSNGNASGTPRLVYTERLSDEEVQQTVDAILSAQLYAFDREGVVARHRDEPNPGPSVEDAGSLGVEIRLPLFPGTKNAGADELSHTFGVNLSDMAEGHFPSIQEYAALRQIFGSFRRAERRARAAAEVVR